MCRVFTHHSEVQITGNEEKFYMPDAHSELPHEFAWLFVKGLGQDALKKDRSLYIKLICNTTVQDTPCP